MDTTLTIRKVGKKWQIWDPTIPGYVSNHQGVMQFARHDAAVAFCQGGGCRYTTEAT